MWSSDFKWSQMNSTIQMFPRQIKWSHLISNVFKCFVMTTCDLRWFQGSALLFSWVRLSQPPILLSNFTWLYRSIETKRETKILVRVSEVGGLSPPVGRLPVTGKSFRVLHACAQWSSKVEMRLKWDAPRSPFSFLGQELFPSPFGALLSSSGFQWLPLIVDDFKWFAMISNDCNWFRMNSNEFNWLQMISTDFDRSQLISNKFKLNTFHLVSIESKWLCVTSSFVD